MFCLNKASSQWGIMSAKNVVLLCWTHRVLFIQVVWSSWHATASVAHSIVCLCSSNVKWSLLIAAVCLCLACSLQICLECNHISKNKTNMSSNAILNTITTFPLLRTRVNAPGNLSRLMWAESRFSIRINTSVWKDFMMNSAVVQSSGIWEALCDCFENNWRGLPAN